MGESVRQLFFEAHCTLPRRVVIHKRTEFRREEREGLIEGLDGISMVDMVEITVDDAFRYLNTKLVNGQVEVDRFPVARGMVIPVGDHETLPRVHGSAAAPRNNWRYYRGKRRIPAPLMIRRHASGTDLQTLASEILGLSKMNWNTCDLYTQVAKRAGAHKGRIVGADHESPVDLVEQTVVIGEDRERLGADGDEILDLGVELVRAELQAQTLADLLAVSEVHNLRRLVYASPGSSRV